MADNGASGSTPETACSAVVVTKLDFTYDGMDKPVLKKFDLDLPTGSRCLLIGQNGAGKSTLLRLLAGRHITKPDDAVIVLDKHAFRDTILNKHRSFLSMDWGMRTISFAGHGVPLQADIAVGDMMKKDQERYPERREELLNLLGVDPNWRMHQASKTHEACVSDGQRRRVQLLLGLVKPFKLLLLDEVTTSLDVVVRQDLLHWLHKESVERGATIIYATHIFDGLDEWPTHLTYLTRDGSTGWQGRLEDLELNRQMKERGETCTLLKVAVHWLRGEQEEYRKETLERRRQVEESGGSDAIRNRNPNLKAYVAGGGFAPGRMAHQGI
ncbi:unnamed protein product [Ectocarpus sp. 12 AP-2014]